MISRQIAKARPLPIANRTSCEKTLTLTKKMMIKSTLAIAIYSLASSSANRASAFSPIARSFSPAIATSFVISSSRSILSTGLEDSTSNNDPAHIQTQPLPPIKSLTSPTILQKLLLSLGYGKELRERVVHKYFHGVDTKNIPQIVECFHSNGAVIRDICSWANRNVSYENVGKLVPPEFLGERCRDFLAAHPDAKVMFRLG